MPDGVQPIWCAHSMPESRFVLPFTTHLYKKKENL
jgi:hypothetical protein